METISKRVVAILLFSLCGVLAPRAEAHSMYQGSILLDFHGNTAEAELQLPEERVRAALYGPSAPKNAPLERDRVADYIGQRFSIYSPDGQRFKVEPIDAPYLTSIEGAPYVVASFRVLPPPGLGVDLFDLHCDALIDRIPAQVILVSSRMDWRMSSFANDPQLIGVLRDTDRKIRIDRRSGNWWRGFSSVFQLGMRHIAEGTDHLLFLLALLLPAPLVAVHASWWSYASARLCISRIARIVTAFTVGHSITLAAGAAGLVHFPSRPIETLIAVSVFISALHALRPLFPGREALVAGGFGLVHGLAFATTLADLGLGRWERVAGILGFNLGIEAMQLAVVAATLPALILLSRSILYSPIRVAGAVFAGTAAAAWILQRLWSIPNPLDTVVTGLAQHAVWIALALTSLGIMASRSVTLRGFPSESPNRVEAAALGRLVRDL